jgi:integrase
LLQRVGARALGLPLVKHDGSITFADAAQAIRDDYAARGLRSGTLLERELTKHLLPYFGHWHLRDIQFDSLLAYVAHRQATGKGLKINARVSNGTIIRELAAVSRVFSLMMKAKKVSTRPAIPSLKPAPPRTGHFTPAQFQSVLKHLPDYLRPVIEFANITGWRTRAEVLPLQWRQVDFATGEVHLDVGTTKNDEARTFVMTVRLRDILTAQQKIVKRLQQAGHLTPYVFPFVKRVKGEIVQVDRIRNYYYAWGKARTAAGLPAHLVHDFRRTAIRRFVRTGVPDSVSMKLSGHKSLSVFRRYDVVSTADLHDAAARLDQNDEVTA